SSALSARRHEMTVPVDGKIPICKEVPESLVFLTSGCCENAHGTIPLLEEHGLGYTLDNPYGFYPLTREEEQFIGEDIVPIGDTGLTGMMGYSCLLAGEKWLLISIELEP